jgi:hypothetical protein
MMNDDKTNKVGAGLIGSSVFCFSFSGSPDFNGKVRNVIPRSILSGARDFRAQSKDRDEESL